MVPQSGHLNGHLNHEFCIFPPVVLPCFATLVSSCLGSSILKLTGSVQNACLLALGWDAPSLSFASDPGPRLCWTPSLPLYGAHTASCPPCPVCLAQHAPWSPVPGPWVGIPLLQPFLGASSCQLLLPDPPGPQGQFLVPFMNWVHILPPPPVWFPAPGSLLFINRHIPSVTVFIAFLFSWTVN